MSLSRLLTPISQKHKPKIWVSYHSVSKSVTIPAGGSKAAEQRDRFSLLRPPSWRLEFFFSSSSFALPRLCSLYRQHQHSCTVYLLWPCLKFKSCTFFSSLLAAEKKINCSFSFVCAIAMYFRTLIIRSTRDLPGNALVILCYGGFFNFCYFRQIKRIWNIFESVKILHQMTLNS